MTHAEESYQMICRSMAREKATPPGESPIVPLPPQIPVGSALSGGAGIVNAVVKWIDPITGGWQVGRGIVQPQPGETELVILDAHSRVVHYVDAERVSEYVVTPEYK